MPFSKHTETVKTLFLVFFSSTILKSTVPKFPFDHYNNNPAVGDHRTCNSLICSDTDGYLCEKVTNDHVSIVEIAMVSPVVQETEIGQRTSFSGQLGVLGEEVFLASVTQSHPVAAGELFSPFGPSPDIRSQ